MKSFEEVLAENEKLVKSLSRKYKARFKQLEFEELEQTAMISLWNAYETYTSGAAKFGTYAYLLIDRSLMRYVRDNLNIQESTDKVQENLNDGYTYFKKEAKKHNKNVDVIKKYGMALDILSEEDFYGDEVVEISTKNQLKTNTLIDEMVENDRERQFLKMRYLGYTMREIAGIYGTSKSTVDRVLKTIGERNLQFDPEFQLAGFFS